MQLMQDLHIHTVWSDGDSSVVPQQTVALIAAVNHAEIIGISDHFEFICDRFDAYEKEVRDAGLHCGTEVNGHEWVERALAVNADYYIFHCFDRDEDYAALESLLASGRPIIIAHPNALETNLDRVPTECLIEINNRYIWRNDWHAYYGKYVDRFSFVINSDAHQPNWLNQTLAQHAADELGVRQTLLFS